MLYKAAFPFHILHYLFFLSELLFHPIVRSFNHFTAPFLLSTYESPWHYDIIIKRLVYFPLLFLSLAVFGIPATFGFILRCLLHLVRRPYVLSFDKSCIPPTVNERRSSLSLGNNYHGNRQTIQSHFKKHLEKTYTISSANLCLLPELLSRINNLPNPDIRSFKIGERIVIDQLFFQNAMESAKYGLLKHRKPQNDSKKEKDKEKNEINHTILTHFPKLDFLCFEETWDRDFSHKLMSELHKVYPWILYDVGKTDFSTNYFTFNSGLMFASKYEILDADFRPFSHSYSQCICNSKGLLMVKVILSSTDQCDNVGYIFATHLQAYQGFETVIQKQLDEVLKWSKEFRVETVKHTDVVLFDVLCGDFNFDNISPVDEPVRNHQLFDIYEDVCRVQPGQDKDWTVGTEMRQMCFWEKQVSTPEGLKEALTDPILRHRYFVDANIQEGTLTEICKTEPLEEEEVKTSLMNVAGRRRIDYILYRKDTPLNVQNFSFVTRLATLTDHIPVSMTFSCKT